MWCGVHARFSGSSASCGLWRSRLRRRMRRTPVGATRTDLRMMARAVELATQAAARGEVPVGAVIYKGETILGEASNDREASADPTGHAEVVALRRAAAAIGGWRLVDCSIAVTLEPCPMCAGALVNSRISRLIYGARDPKAGAVDTLYDLCRDPRLNHRIYVVGGVMMRKCAAMLSDFFRMRRQEARSKKRSS